MMLFDAFHDTWYAEQETLESWPMMSRVAI
jgi:hypothetical protein